jgi:hypothetical protein
MNFVGLLPNERIFILTDGRSVGTSDTREAFYRHLGAEQQVRLLDPVESDDCIQRCRLLRNLDHHEAERRLHAMAAALGEWIDRINPALVVSHMVDGYVTHILSILAYRRGIKFVGYALSYFPDRLQLTSYSNGVAFNIRTPSHCEVEETIEGLLNPFFRQDYGQRADYPLHRHLLRVGRYYVKRLVFLAKGHLERDPLHQYYAQTPYLAERRNVWNFPSKKYFNHNWLLELNSFRKRSFPAVYVPLGFFPEATIDYWIEDKSILDYEGKIGEIVNAVSPSCVVIVKEHPQMLGSRKLDFYRHLGTIPNVILVPPLEYATTVMENCDAVLLGAGSTGVEAVLRDKPLFTFSKTSYWFAGAGASFLDLADIGSWGKSIVEGISLARPLSQAEKYEFIKNCLRSTAFSRPGGRHWPLVDPVHLTMLMETANVPVRRPGSDSPHAW